MTFNDEAVIAAVLRVMRGEPERTVAESIGTDPLNVRNWVRGTNRAKCQIEAERRYRKQQK